MRQVKVMKKDIMNLIDFKSDETKDVEYFRLNNVSYLKRWTKDAFGNDIDRLEINFDTINDVNFSIYDREIKSRDYEGIIRECQEITKAFFDEVSATLIKNLGAGYRNTSKKRP